MQTNFSLARLADGDLQEMERILRTCVHCGFCLATCPTYVLLGDELDSPRGRIYLIKDMLEGDKPASKEVVRHLDRCLSCLSCMTTCPSGVNYMHLIDHARGHVAATHTRPRGERRLHRFILAVLPRPGLMRPLLALARLAAPFSRFLPKSLGAFPALLPPAGFSDKSDSPPGPGIYPAEGERRMRVALLTGCVQETLRPAIDAATIRLLTRHGLEVVVAADQGCCGALAHHMGEVETALASVRANVAAWESVITEGGLDAIVINASGCGTMVKDYGFLLSGDAQWAGRAAAISALARDVSEIMAEIGFQRPAVSPVNGVRVGYLAACSLRHGQKIATEPMTLLKDAGFEIVEPDEAHLCCGSAGAYNLLQPELAGQLGARKAGHFENLGVRVIAAGNIGCLVQMAAHVDGPLAHTVELLDWASGGPPPPGLKTKKQLEIIPRRGRRRLAGYLSRPRCRREPRR